MATTKKNPFLGPDGQAAAPIFGAIGKQFKRYMEYREKRERRIRDAASSTPPSSSTSTKGKTRKNGQKATLNGKPVVWKNGKWVAAPSRTVPKGSMNISKAGKKQAAANRAEAKAKREKAAAAAERKRLADQRAGSSNTPPTETKPPKPPAKTDNRSILTKEIDGLTKFIATHKGKKGMERALAQASKSIAAKKKEKADNLSIRSQGQKSYNRESA